MNTLRVTSGTLRGRRVAVPRGDVRPTSEMARQAYFDIVGSRVDGARFLDLFAGSGIFSFEAVSRGAAEAVAVDASRRNAAAIERTASALAAPVRTVVGDAAGAVRRLSGTPFRLVYADPPYDWESHRELLEVIDGELPLEDEALVAVEHRRRTTPFLSGDEPIPLRRLAPWRRAEYGEIWISFFIA